MSTIRQTVLKYGLIQRQQRRFIPIQLNRFSTTKLHGTIQRQTSQKSKTPEEKLIHLRTFLCTVEKKYTTKKTDN